MKLTHKISNVLLALVTSTALSACAADLGDETTPTHGGPTAERVLDSVRSLTDSHRAPDIHQVPTGGQRAVLGKGHMSAMVAKVGTDGRVTTSCVDNEQAAAAFLTATEVK